MTHELRGVPDDATASETAAWGRAHDHAWRYFELHAGQRMAVFNFYVVISGLVVAGIAATLQGSARFAALGVALGAVLVLLAFVFWKLDQRVSFLIKHAEKAQTVAEAKLLPFEARLFSLEPAAFVAERSRRSGFGGPWTLGIAFRTVYAAAALFGVASVALCASRAAGWVSWEAKVEEASTTGRRDGAIRR